MRSRLSIDLLVVNIAALLLVAVIALIPSSLSNVPRLVLGLPFALFFPGYTLVAALFPGRETLSGTWRLGLSAGLSLAVVPLIGLVLNYTPWGITLHPVLVSVTFFIMGTSIIAFYRRLRLPPDERFSPRLPLPSPLGGGRALDRALGVLLALSVVAAVGSLAYVVATPTEGERFTELSVLGRDGTADCYPAEFVLEGQAVALVGYECSGQAVQYVEEQVGWVTLGIRNQEQQAVEYRVEIAIDGEPVAEVSPILLGHGEEWQQEVGFAPTRAGPGQKVEFLLYEGTATEASLEVHLWIDASQGAP